MATASSVLCIDEYLHTSYKPDLDFVEGMLQERHMGEYEHNKLQTLIAVLFTVNARLWHTDTVVEQRIRVTADRVRICDVAVLRADAPRESVTITPPLICIEILSPEDRLARAKAVLSDYLVMGVQNIWLLDPLRRAAWTYDAAGLQEADPTRLIVPQTPIHLDLTEAFAAID